jgi:hypothetical protein
MGPECRKLSETLKWAAFPAAERATPASSSASTGRNAQSALSAAPLVLKLTVDNPFRGLDFFETPEGLLVRG